MGSFNPLERKVASVLDRYPGIKKRVKSAYQRGNYHVYGDREFEYDIHPDARIRTPDRAFGVDETEVSLFFGYFDVSPWNESMDSAVYHAIRSEGAVDLVHYEQGRRTVLGRSTAWNYQQGSRTQWHPTRSDRVLYNDVVDGEAVLQVVDTDGTPVRTLSMPLQAANPTRDEVASLDYRRLDRRRPAYGYGTDDGSSLREPDRDGIWIVDLSDAGGPELVVPLAELFEGDEEGDDYENHYVNHVFYDPTGERFAFVHRWRDDEGRASRLYVADRTGQDRRLLMDDRVVSHYCWLDAKRLLVWGRSERFGDGYHVVDVETGEFEYLDDLDGYGDGHPSVSPDGRWIVTDTYPDRTRKRHLILYDLEHGELTELGQFFAPLSYRGEKRCDLHPRWSPDGSAISIDSTHEGRRYSHVLDVEELLDD